MISVDTSNKRHHVAIIGAGLGGLSAAIHLRMRGFEVTIYEANGRVGGRAGQIIADGFTFDTGPTLLNYPWVFEELFNAAGRKLSDYAELIPIDPSIRYYWPDGKTLSLSTSLTALVSEFERVEPGSGPGLFAFMADAAGKYRLSFEHLVTGNFDHVQQWIGALTLAQWLRVGVWRSFDRELGRFFRSSYIRDALGSYAMYLGGSPHQLPGIFTILPYGELAMGLWLPRGGIYGLVRGIEQLARELGVRIEMGQSVRKILVQNGSVHGLELADAPEVRCPLIVSNVDVPTTQRKLLSGLPNPARAPRMTPSVLTFYWGIRGKLSGAGHHMIFLPGDSELAYKQLIQTGEIPREMPFYVSIASESDASLAPPGDSAVFVLIPLPLSLMSRPEDLQGIAAVLKSRVIERLGKHGIRLSPSAVVMEQTLNPADWAERCGLFQGSAFGAAHTLFQMGFFRQPNRERSVRGLYYVGASTVPGTGLPMVTLGGRMTAERISADVH
jgi:phytoene desaturase